MTQIKTEIVIQAIDEFSGAMNKISAGIDRMQPAFEKMSMIGTAAFAAISGVAYKAISDYKGVEMAQKQLETAVIAVSHGTMQQVDAINAVTSALEKKGVIDADSLKVGAAQLSTFGLTTKMVTDLVPALADLTVNQFGVNASSDQFNQSANMMAKVLQGQFGILEKSGIRFSELQQKMIKTGTDTEKTKAIIEGLNQNLKLTNETARQTAEGAMAALNVSIGNISENLGAALLPALNKLMQAITPVIERISAWTEAHPDLMVKILAATAGLAALVAGLGFLGMALPGIVTAIGALGGALTFLTLNPLGAAIVIFGILAKDHIIPLAQKIMELAGKVNSLSDAWRMLKDGLGQLMNFIDSKIGLITILKDAWNSIALVFNTKLMPEIQKFAAALVPLMPAVKIFAEIVGVILYGAFITAIKIIEVIIIVLTDKLAQAFEIANGAIKIASGIWDGFTTGLSKVITVIDKVISKMSQLNILSKAQSLVGNVLGFGGARASGGPVSGGSAYLVGEQGPELFVPGSSGSIVPNGSLGGGVSGGAVNVYITGNTLLDRDSAKKIGDLIIKQLKFNTAL